MRLDVYLVEKGHYKSRELAKEAISKGLVLVDDKVVYKASMDIIDQKVAAHNTFKYVSRGGYKLDGAIKGFFLDFTDKVIVDIGASTGGFTDCALQNGAKLVYAIDVGTKQLDERLWNNEKIVSLEQTNFLDIPSFPQKIDYYIMDVSFISIKQIIPHIKKLGGKRIIALIKPQFEVGPKFLNKNGVLKDRAMHVNVLKDISLFMTNVGYYIHKLILSPIKGKSGNIEYLVEIREESNSNIDIYQTINEAFR